MCKNHNKKKMLFILGSMGKGGAERVVSILANKYCEKGWDVRIILLLENRCEYSLNPNVKIIPLINKKTKRILQLPNWIYQIRKYVKEYQPDKIVSFVARVNIITILSCFGLGKELIISERNDPKLDGRSIFVKYLTYVLYPFSKKIIFQTKWALSCFPKFIRNKGVIIYNPVSVTKYSNDKPNKKIVSVGRLAEQKNHSLLIDAFSIVNKTYPEYSLYIYGDGPLKKQLEKKVLQLRLSNVIFLKGAIANIHEEISDAELFVLSSNYEGLSNALLEAMMMGLPCISTNCAGSNEVIENKVNGLLVPLKDKISLSEAIIGLIKNKDSARCLSKNAKKESIRYDTHHIITQWNKIIYD